MLDKPIEDPWASINYWDTTKEDENAKPLNKKLGKATPVMSSAQQAQYIKDFASNADNYPSPEELNAMGLNLSEWYENYINDPNEIFLPKNRWVHECVAKPEEIEKNLYLIKMLSDIYMQQTYLPVKFNNGEYVDVPELRIRLVSRTLHQHHQEVPEDRLHTLPAKYNQEDFENISYDWVIRWTPKFDCTLTFFTNETIESEINIVTPETKVEYVGNQEKDILVPFFIKKNFYKTSPYLKHDSDILYMRVERK